MARARLSGEKSHKFWLRVAFADIVLVQLVDMHPEAVPKNDHGDIQALHHVVRTETSLEMQRVWILVMLIQDDRPWLRLPLPSHGSQPWGQLERLLQTKLP